ncbi:Uncharacterised protein [Shigella flexneri]|nr:Uncharacterised protein [Shigella flexneri]
MVEQHDATADVTSARVVIAGNQRAHARIGPQNARFRHHGGQFFPFTQQNINLFCRHSIIVNLVVINT